MSIGGRCGGLWLLIVAGLVRHWVFECERSCRAMSSIFFIELLAASRAFIVNVIIPVSRVYSY